MKKTILYLFGFLLIQFALSWIVYAAWLLATGSSQEYVMSVFGGAHPEAITAPMMILASALSGAITIAVFVWRKWAVMSPSYLRQRHWDVFFWCAVASLGTIIPSIWLQEQMPAMKDYMADSFTAIMTNDYGYFVLCLLTPFVEEMVFRGAILRTLLCSVSNHWVAILISAALFAVVHLNPAQMPHALLMGLLLGWMYYRTGSILPGVVLHWVNNTVAYAVTILLPASNDMTLSQLFGGNQTSIILSIVFSLFIFLPAIYQLNMRMKR